jgi:uncharacterized membrane protein YbhN (UPF0104 family)
MNYSAAKAMDLPVTIIYFIALIPLSTILLLLPLSIGAIGIQEGGYIFLFTLAGLTASESLSISLLMRSIGWMLLIPGGAVFMYDSVRLKQLKDFPVR